MNSSVHIMAASASRGQGNSEINAPGCASAHRKSVCAVSQVKGAEVTSSGWAAPIAIVSASHCGHSCSFVLFRSIHKAIVGLEPGSASTFCKRVRCSQAYEQRQRDVGQPSGAKWCTVQHFGCFAAQTLDQQAVMQTPSAFGHGFRVPGAQQSM